MADGPDLFECSICLQLLNDPVTTACGHSYCLRCINAFWDERNTSREDYSCPQCRQTYTSRPVLKRSILVATLLEEHERTASHNADAAAAAAAAPGDVQCDACTGTKRRAWMFCLECLASYCETHLKPHFEVATLRSHSLIDPSLREGQGQPVRPPRQTSGDLLPLRSAVRVRDVRDRGAQFPRHGDTDGRTV